MPSTQLFWIEVPTPGRLAIAVRPRGGDWLEDEARAWKNAGISAVVSLLTPDEVAHFHLETEADSCERSGIRFLPFPIADRDVPASRAQFQRLIEQLAGAVLKGEKVLIHCRQGIGRSTLIAAGVLRRLGIGLDDALDRIQLSRGLPVPETVDQRKWLDEVLEDHSQKKQTA